MHKIRIESIKRSSPKNKLVCHLKRRNIVNAHAMKVNIEFTSLGSTIIVDCSVIIVRFEIHLN